MSPRKSLRHKRTKYFYISLRTAQHVNVIILLNLIIESEFHRKIDSFTNHVGCSKKKNFLCRLVSLSHVFRVEQCFESCQLNFGLHLNKRVIVLHCLLFDQIQNTISYIKLFKHSVLRFMVSMWSVSL